MSIWGRSFQKIERENRKIYTDRISQLSSNKDATSFFLFLTILLQFDLFKYAEPNWDCPASDHVLWALFSYQWPLLQVCIITYILPMYYRPVNNQYKLSDSEFLLVKLHSTPLGTLLWSSKDYFAYFQFGCRNFTFSEVHMELVYTNDLTFV